MAIRPWACRQCYLTRAPPEHCRPYGAPSFPTYPPPCISKHPFCGIRPHACLYKFSIVDWHGRCLLIQGPGQNKQASPESGLAGPEGDIMSFWPLKSIHFRQVLYGFSTRRNAMWFIVENLMLFLSFWKPFCDFGSKVFISDRFYKGFRNAFLAFEDLVFVGFIRLFDMAECHVEFIYKRNAFLIISDAILRFGLPNDWNSTGFIRYFDQLFGCSKIL